ncbi:MAG: helix-turn-helix domain-containing protein [Syntrophales bacterium]
MNENDNIPQNNSGSTPGETVENLKALREARGLSLKDIFAATRISIVNLAALENGDFKSLPSPIYTKSFIKKYAKKIAIDEKPLLDRYEVYLATTSKPAEAEEVRKPWPENSRRYLFLYGSLAIVIIAGLIVLAVFLYHGDKPATPAAPVAKPASAPAVPPAVNNAAPTAALPQTTAAVSTAPEKTVSPSPDQSLTGKYHLVIEARELTWMRIVADKKNRSEILLKPGEKIERRAEEGFQLYIGNAGGVDLFFQGKPLGAPGKRGAVVTVNLPAEEPKKENN